jgi:hypothetical protein
VLTRPSLRVMIESGCLFADREMTFRKLRK